MPTRTAVAISLDHVLSLCLAPHPLCQSTEHSSAGLLLGRTERAARAAELQLCAQAR